MRIGWQEMKTAGTCKQQCLRFSCLYMWSPVTILCVVCHSPPPSRIVQQEKKTKRSAHAGNNAGSPPADTMNGKYAMSDVQARCGMHTSECASGPTRSLGWSFSC